MRVIKRIQSNLHALTVLGIGAVILFGNVYATGLSRLDFFAYDDKDGMTVLTSVAGLEQGIAPGWLLTGSLLWDRIAVEPGLAGVVPSGGHVHAAKRAASQSVTASPDSGGSDADANYTGDLPSAGVIDGISGASQRASSVGGGNVQSRYDASMGLAKQIGHGAFPHRVGGHFSVSSEEDYLALTGIMDASLELQQRNVTLSGYIGYGHDRITPFLPPPGEAERWPAHQSRYLLGFGISQVTGRRSLISAAYGLGLQKGMLESPYRRATVVTTQFPEKLPNSRYRNHGAFTWSYSPWNHWALHHRQGFYYDSWNYHAWIPETALNWEPASDWLFILRHRYTEQDAAEFWQHHYENLDGFRSGDYRLDGLTQQALTLECEWSHEFGTKKIGLGGHISRFWQKSLASGANPRGFTGGLSTQWGW